MQKFDENCGARCRERSSLTFRGESGEEAQQAIDGIGAVIENGLGEGRGK